MNLFLTSDLSIGSNTIYIFDKKSSLWPILKTSTSV